MSLRKWLFGWMYHNLLTGRDGPNMDDPFTRDVRAPLLADAAGDVLEIGAGNGANLALYPTGVRVTVLEPNAYLRRHLAEACDGQCVEVVDGVGESLPFPPESFDTVLTTHVLCSVSDQAAVLAEVRRVLRPGGQFLFLEHVAAEPGSAAARAQRVFNPLWKAVGDGCHLTRDTGGAIRAAGFRDVTLREFEIDAPGIVASHIAGRATA